ncbi:hypothetical protein [Subtercola boreus]|uniref:Uncharacterized protein n=1 Tax=Subtercola boreus TaxID=120213 RepID=A0A3E0W8C1_9MICO|nr:hypothetical protein [Subtercola boreus]RFA18042.1 hypothetical protein B7R24_15425 [Subtercola boreus]RFA18424.1 hypothetical protein B7R23_15460 [Subtercola boreus]RFA24953.1 hypothetical protein B7R25_15455 [Subtercola boreus]
MSDWYARFERDAAFREAVAEAYAGRHDVGDALWWLEHPELDAPSGTASPLAPLAGLQRAAYGRPDAGGSAVRGEAGGAGGRVPGEAGGAGEREGRALEVLQAFEAMIERDRRDTLEAVDAAVPDARPEHGRRRTFVVAGAIVAAVCLAGGLALAAAAVFGGGAGPGSSSAGSASQGEAGSTSAPDRSGTSYGTAGENGAADSSTAAAAPALTASPFPNFPPGIGADSYAAIFSQPQSAADLPPEPLPVDLRPASFRSLSSGQYTAGAVYAAVNTANEVCLVVYGNATDYGTTCANVAVVAARGLQVSLTTTDHRDQTGLLVPAVALSARWEPDGNFTLDQSTPYDRD